MLFQRPSTEADAPAIAAIYAHYVLNSTATFELDPPDVEEIGKRRRHVLDRGLPHLVVESDGAVLGYAYSSPYRPRKAYRFTVEDSIYIHPEYTRKGFGRLLLAALIEGCEPAGFRQMVAVIGGADNLASIRLHEHFGFRHAGVLRAIGFKLGRWADTVLMQRALGEGDRTIPSELTSRR